MKAKSFAFFIHLSLSISVALLVMLLVFRLWYPAPLHDLVGVEHIFYLLVGIDVIIGPVLTFIVFKKGKPSLTTDLSLIAFFQLAALVYGIWTVAQGRPAWIVFNVDRFTLVQVIELDTRQRDKTAAEYRSPSWFGPSWVSAEAPSDIEARNTLTLESVFAGVDLPQRTDLYQPLENAHDDIRRRAMSLEKLTQYNTAEAVEQAKLRWPQANAYLPLDYKMRFATVLINTESAEVVGITPLIPW
ncbi:MAG: TfpX/TfpZ family type IV pilin accessory protein [Candidatus Thiodiazotropha sp. (ex. Lucinoma kazani)]